MAEERLNNLEEKLKQLLAELEGDTGEKDWNALETSLDEQAKGGVEAGFGALLSTISGEADTADWNAIASKLDAHEAAGKRKRKAAYYISSVVAIVATILLLVANPFTGEQESTNAVGETQTDTVAETTKKPENVLNDKPGVNTNPSEPIVRDFEAEMYGHSLIFGESDENQINQSRNTNSANTSVQDGNPTQNDDVLNDYFETEQDILTNNDIPEESEKGNADNRRITDIDNIDVDDNQEPNVIAKADDEDDVNEEEDDEEQEPTLDPAPTPQPKQKNQLDENPLRNKITVGLLLSPEYVISSFNANPTESSWMVNRKYEDINNNQRSNAMGFSTGLNFDYNPFKNFRVQAAVKYTENRENIDFNFEQDEVIIIDRIGKQLYYFQLPPDERTQVEHATTNKISYIEVPFMVGYNFNLGNSRWSIAPSIGGSYSRLLSASGAKLNETTLEVEDLTENDLNKTNWTLQASVGAYYQITNRFSVGVLPTYKTYLQTIETGSNYLRNRPYTFGITTGIRYSVF